jgi:osmotically-inducible protein OsmY
MTSTLKRPAYLVLACAAALSLPVLAPAADPARSPGPDVYTVQTQQGEPSITVTARRGEDQRLNDEVVSAIRSDARISGRIGVDTLDAYVTLTGRVMTPAMAERAASDARGVAGVQDVTSYIRSRVGEE